MSASAKGLILFAHGARDARWAEPFERLRGLLQEQLAAAATPVQVALAYLELMQPDLITAAEQLFAQGCASLTVVPVFLGQGGHVRRDLPALIAQLQATYPERLIQCAGAVGEDDKVLAAMADYCWRAIQI